MKLIINHDRCLVEGRDSKREKEVDRAKVWFIVRSKFRRETKRRYLGYAWLVLDPLIISLIYLFVFTVVKARIGPDSILVGITMYRVFQSSIMSGLNAIPDPNGGLKCERVPTKVLLSATVYHRLIDIFLQTILITIILIIYFKIPIVGGMLFLLLAQVMGFLSFGLGSIISPAVARIPDIKTIVGYVLRLGFYASPALYPMYKMTGTHYLVNTYNPFAFFAELGRDILGIKSVFNDLSTISFSIILSVLLIFTIIGFARIDYLRWRMTTWS